MTMTMMHPQEVSMIRTLSTRLTQVYAALGMLPFSVIQLMARCSMAVIFWRSGQTKLANWDLTLQLFASEYHVPLLPPEIAAPLAASVELTTPILLILGLATRIATLPMIGMTLIIQTFVYPANWPDHLTWMTFLLLLLTRGPGMFSLDYLIARGFGRTTSSAGRL
jgi:putative oxidoreductase